MRTAARAGMVAAWGVWGMVSACASSPQADPAAPVPTDTTDTPAAATPAAAPVKEPVASGLDCAAAEALCDGGLCKVTVKNTCPQPVTCDLAIAATCKNGQEMVEAKARTRDTVAAATDGEVGVVANCTMGEVIHTQVTEFRCQ